MSELFLPFSARKVIDLSHPLASDIPSWDGAIHPYELKETRADTPFGVSFCLQNINMPMGLSTHIDAPLHCFFDGLSIDQIPIGDLIRPFYLMDVSPLIAEETFTLSADEIRLYEKRNGKIPKGSHVIVHTGWSRYWNESVRYRNNLVFPSIGEDAALLFFERRIASLGVDTLSPDAGLSDFPVHRTLLKNGIFIIENVASLPAESIDNALLGIFPLNIQGAAESPCRLLLFVP